MQDKNLVLGFRAQPEERQKLEDMAEATGQGLSQVLRDLVRNAKLERVEVLRVASTLTLGSELQNV